MKVLIAVDQSEASKACIDGVLAYNWPAGTQFKLLTVLKSDLLDVLEDPLPAQSHSGPQARHFLFSLAETFKKSKCGNVVGVHMLLGPPAKAILSIANQWNAELIVLGSNCKGPIQRTFLGSVSSSVADRAFCPVLIMRHTRSQPAFAKIVVAMDGTECDSAVLAWLQTQPWVPGTEFCFLSVLPSLPRDFISENLSTSECLARMEEHAMREDQSIEYLEQVVQNSPLLAAYPCKFEVTDGVAAECIAKTAIDWSASLVVVGSHNRHGLDKILNGSVSAKTASECNCSVALVKHGTSKQNSNTEFDDQQMTSPTETTTPHVPIPRL